MPSKIYLVTGGARSGKSSYAQKLCETLSAKPIYLATSKVWDDDFKERIQKHKDDRGDQWQTIEEPLFPSKHSNEFSGKVILVDCLTLWLTNFFIEEDALTSAKEEDSKPGSGGSAAADRALKRIKEEFEKLTEQWDATFVIVTNEIGSGTHANDNITRKFVDAQGWFNQHVAQKSERVVHVVSGIANIIKGPNLCNDKRNPLSLPSRQQSDEAKMLDAFLSTRPMMMDSKGYFLVKVDQKRALIVVSFMSCILNDEGEVCDFNGVKISCCSGSKQREATETFEGRTAKDITVKIFEQWQHASIVSVGHAAYIGREVQKAEDALYSGVFFQQD